MTATTKLETHLSYRYFSRVQLRSTAAMAGVQAASIHGGIGSRVDLTCLVCWTSGNYKVASRGGDFVLWKLSLNSVGEIQRSRARECQLAVPPT